MVRGVTLVLYKNSRGMLIKSKGRTGARKRAALMALRPADKKARCEAAWALYLSRMTQRGRFRSLASTLKRAAGL